MPGIETNIFPVLNLKQLSARYCLYKVKGLHRSQREYFQNVNALTRDFSFSLAKPVTTITRGENLYLAVRDDAPELPASKTVTRNTVYLERVGETFDLDFSKNSPEEDEIRLKFLQFMLRGPLGNDGRLWSPGPGQPFFTYHPLPTGQGIDHFRGFNVRAVVTPDGGMGLCVDIANKYVGERPMPIRMSRGEFERWKKRKYIYHMGHLWYEFRPEFLDDRNVTEYIVPEAEIPLLEFIRRGSRKPYPQDLARLPQDASVVCYFNNKGEQRSAPAALCYPVHGPHDRVMKKLHRQSIIGPSERRTLIHGYVQSFLSKLKFGQVELQVSKYPLEAPAKKFLVPDFKFGGGRIISVRGTEGAHHVSLDNLGETRLAMLKRSGPGFYKDKLLDRQYLIFPKSVLESHGGELIEALATTVDDLFPQEDGYAPKVVSYDDSGPKTFVAQSAAILKAVENECDKPGYGLVMIHGIHDRDRRKEDPLAAMVMQKLRDYKIHCTVMHSAFSSECYRFSRTPEGKTFYRVLQSKRGQLAGYLRGVAINKILLNNQRWPFVLSTRLHADTIVGLDVKENTAGVVVVGHNGEDIRFISDTSAQREKLDERQVKRLLIEILTKEAETRQDLIRSVVLHRDGRAYQSELDGSDQAIEHLVNLGIVSHDATLTVLEIQKSAPVPLRLFDVTDLSEGGTRVWNPQIGYYYMMSPVDGYLCSTGRAFSRPGTVKPLHVKHVQGTLPLEKCLEDIYYLTSLAWTRPEDCTRNPITTKLNDRYLGEQAGKFDEEAFREAIAAVKGVTV